LISQPGAVVDALPDAQPTPEAALDRARQRRMLDAILARLDLELRSVFILYELEGMTMAEIASELSLPPGTVASRLRRARERFEREVARQRSSAARKEPT
jgi:RNA polymerase sigma-70 factor (ECF subfamily)